MSDVIVGEKNGFLYILGKGLPIKLSVEQAQDVVGGICAIKNWRVIDATTPGDICTIVPAEEDWCDCGHAELLHNEVPCRGVLSWPNDDDPLGIGPIPQCECIKFMPGGRNRALTKTRKLLDESRNKTMNKCPSCKHPIHGKELCNAILLGSPTCFCFCVWHEEACVV